MALRKKPLLIRVVILVGAIGIVALLLLVCHCPMGLDKAVEMAAEGIGQSLTEAIEVDV